MKWLDLLARWWLGRNTVVDPDMERWRVRTGHIRAHRMPTIMTGGGR